MTKGGVMKKYFFILAFMIICGNVNAQECYYVYIDNHSPIDNENGGQNEMGDVVDVIPCSKITPPKHDYKNFDIIKMKLTKVEAEELKSSLLSEEVGESGDKTLLKSSKNKIDTKLLTEEKEYTKDEILPKITVKSISVSIDSR